MYIFILFENNSCYNRFSVRFAYTFNLYTDLRCKCFSSIN